MKVKGWGGVVLGGLLAAEAAAWQVGSTECNNTNPGEYGLGYVIQRINAGEGSDTISFGVSGAFSCSGTVTSRVVEVSGYGQAVMLCGNIGLAQGGAVRFLAVSNAVLGLGGEAGTLESVRCYNANVSAGSGYTFDDCGFYNTFARTLTVGSGNVFSDCVFSNVTVVMENDNRLDESNLWPFSSLTSSVTMGSGNYLAGPRSVRLQIYGGTNRVINGFAAAVNCGGDGNELTNLWVAGSDSCLVSGTNTLLGGNLFWLGRDNAVRVSGVSNRFLNCAFVSNNVGLRLEGNYNVVQGCRVGHSGGGSTAWPHREHGISVEGDYNQIGGTNDGAANVILGSSAAGSDGAGIMLWGDHNVVEGNFIGVSEDRLWFGDNYGWGVRVEGSYNTVGGWAVASRNWISGNRRGGIWFQSGISNFAGRNVIGLAPVAWDILANGDQPGEHGVEIAGSSGLVTLRRNFIAGNTNGFGVYGEGPVEALANTFGMDVLERVQPNGYGGICAGGTGGRIGGEPVGDRNYVVGSLSPATNHGAIVLRNASQYQVLNNYVGVATDGRTVLSNASHGILLVDSSEVTVGGRDTLEVNLVAGSGGAGIALYGATRCTVAGNLVGSQEDGCLPAEDGNALGILLYNARSNWIGGAADRLPNTIVANHGDGIRMESASRYNVLRGNFIGLTTNNQPLGNGGQGICLVGAGTSYCQYNTIGSTCAWDLAGANFIVNNRSNGIHLATRAWENAVDGNCIGTGTGRVESGYGNLGHGIYAYGNYNVIGSNWANLVVGNGRDGIRLETASGTRIYNNYIGLAPGGIFRLTNLPNAGHGIAIVSNADFNRIGQRRTHLANQIAANRGDGVYVGPWCDGNNLAGNFIGEGANYEADVNGGAGIRLVANRNNWIGDVGASGGGNLVDGFTGIWYVGTTNNYTYDNYVGKYAGGFSSTDLLVGIRLTGCRREILGQFDTTNYVSNAREAAVRVEEGACDNRLSYLVVGVLGENPGCGIVLSNAVNNTIGPAVRVERSAVGLWLQDCPSNAIYGSCFGVTNEEDRIWGGGNRRAGVRLERCQDVRLGDVMAPGLVNTISGNASNGVEILESEGIRVMANYVGLAPHGSNALPNNGHGVLVRASTNVLIGQGIATRNYLSGNQGDGLHVQDQPLGPAVIVSGNRIGLAAGLTDTNPAPNGGHGLCLENTASNVIGGSAAGDRNYIAGNAGCGVVVRGSAARGNVILGNYIGVDAVGAAEPNAAHGVWLDGAPLNLVGVVSLNVISGNAGSGVYILGLTASNNMIVANRIGVMPYGSGPLSNGSNGVEIVDAPANLVAQNILGGNAGHGVVVANSGGPDLARFNNIAANWIGMHTNQQAVPNGGDGVQVCNATYNYVHGGNMIGGNRSNGVAVVDMGAHDNFIQANLIGCGPDTTLPVPNGAHGVLLFGGDNNRVGSTNAWEANLIAYNGVHGVNVARGVGNRILGNSIFGNAWMGINLGTAGVSQAEQDGVPNRYQRFPALTNVFRGSLHLDGELQTASNSEYLVELYGNPAVNPAGFGEGRFLLGRARLFTDAAGRAALAVVYPFTLPTGYIVTATATDTNGNTSEFSLPATVTAAPDSDGDGIPDFYQALHTNLNQAVTNDYDGDGMTDHDEYIAGTDPEDSSSFLHVTLGSLVVPATSQGRVYTLEYATNLVEGAWFPSGQATGTDAALVFEMPTLTNMEAAAFRARGGLP